MKNTKPVNDLKVRREKLGLSLAEVAEQSGYSVASINGMENHGVGSQRLREKLELLLRAPQKVSTALDPPTPPQRAEEEKSVEFWKTRALVAEQKVIRLRRAVLGLLRVMDETELRSPDEKISG